MVARFLKETLTVECIHCKGKLVRSTAPFSVTRNGYHISWDAVPAWVCSQCGEPLFDKQEVDAIQQTLERLDEQNRQLHTPAA